MAQTQHRSKLWQNYGARRLFGAILKLAVQATRTVGIKHIVFGQYQAEPYPQKSLLFANGLTVRNAGPTRRAWGVDRQFAGRRDSQTRAIRMVQRDNDGAAIVRCSVRAAALRYAPAVM